MMSSVNDAGECRAKNELVGMRRNGGGTEERCGLLAVVASDTSKRILESQGASQHTVEVAS